MKKSLDRGLTMDDSLSIKGIAIVMMLFHHLFYKKELSEPYNVNFLPFGEEFVVDISILCKICVSIFAFISGYGLLKSIQNIALDRVNVSKWIVVRLFKTLTGFWFVYIFVFTISMFLNRLPLHIYFTESTTAGILYVINDFLGLSKLMGTPSLSGAWWYMSAAILYIVLVPILYMLAKRIGYLSVLLLYIAIPRVLNIGFLGGTNPYTFLLSVIFGMCFAEYHLFERFETAIKSFRPIVRFCICFVLFGFFVIGAYFLKKSGYYASTAWELNYGVMPVLILCFFKYCVIPIPGVNVILRFLGVYSMTMFLTHTFLRSYYLQSFIYGYERNFIVVTLVMIVTSVLLAVILDYAKRLCRYDRLVDAALARISAMFDKSAVAASPPPQRESNDGR